MIIFIIGISTSDLLFNHIIYDQPYEFIIHPKVPLTLDNWPSATTLKCWTCRKKIDGRPIPIPVRKEVKYINKGIACSLECGKTYYLTYKDPDIDQREILKHIEIFIGACRELGYDIININMREHFYKQPEFGGY